MGPNKDGERKVMSKEEKMELVSKAVDAGFAVKLSKYSVESLEEMNEALDIFTGLSIRFRGNEEKERAWVNINDSFQRSDDNFEAVIFLK